MKNKFYFPDFEEDRCCTIDYILDEMRKRELTECKVAIAIRETRSDYFYCKAHGESGTKSDVGCGSECRFYEPRNGISGCCMHWGYCYVPGKEFMLTINKKLCQ